MTDPRVYPQIDGMKVRHTKRGACVVELDYWADPTRNQTWAEEMRAVIGDVNFEREFKRNWKVAAGTAFYPEFKQDTDKRILVLPRLIKGPVYRGWDFGYRRPACVWFQYSKKQKRVWVLRELMPEDIDVWAFRDLVLYLSGQRTEEFLAKRPRALEWAQKLKEDPRYPNPPWFFSSPSDPLQFIDYAGPEANYHTAIVGQDQPERSSAEVLAAEGINLGIYGMEVSDRTLLIRKLMYLREDGYAGLILDPACKILIEAFLGGLPFKNPTKQNPVPTEPAKDGKYEHLHDALGYGIFNVVDLVELDEVWRPEPVITYEGRNVVPRNPDELVLGNSVALKELRDPWTSGF